MFDRDDTRDRDDFDDERRHVRAQRQHERRAADEYRATGITLEPFPDFNHNTDTEDHA